MLAAATTSVPIWGLFTFLMGSQLALYGIIIKQALTKRKGKNGPCNKNMTITSPATAPHEHEYVTEQMCKQTQKTIRAEVQILGVVVSHVKEIVGRFEQAHKTEHETMVGHFDQNMEQLKELIKKNS